MEIDFTRLDPALGYKVLTGLITPRPIAWVSTVDPDGNRNLAPFSFFNVFGSNPPVVVVAPGNRGHEPKDTAANIRATGMFVVNLVEEAQAEAMVATAGNYGPEVDEFAAAGLDAAESARVAPPRVKDAPASFECLEHTTMRIGGNRLVIGRVVHAHVRDGILEPETYRRIDDAVHLVGRMYGPDGYTRTRDRFEISRPG